MRERQCATQEQMKTNLSARVPMRLGAIRDLRQQATGSWAPIDGCMSSSICCITGCSDKCPLLMDSLRLA